MNCASCSASTSNIRLSTYCRSPIGSGCSQSKLLPSGETLLTAFILSSGRACKHATMIDLDQLAKYLEGGAPVNLPNRHKDLPLNLAIRKGDIEAVKLMLASGADPHLTNGMGMSALHTACLASRTNIVDLLLTTSVQVNKKTKRTSKQATKDTTKDVAKDAKVASPTSPLCLAIENKSIGIVELLLAHGADPNEIDMMGYTPLMRSCRDGNTPIVKYLLSYGADVRIVNDKGLSALSIAIAQGACDVVTDILERGFDINAGICTVAEPQVVPLIAAILANCQRCFDTLLDYGAELHFQLSNGLFPLHFTFCKEYLLRSTYHHINTQLPNREARVFRLKAANTLIKQGANLQPIWDTFCTSYKSSPIQYDKRNPEFYELCIKSFGLNINDQNVVDHDNLAIFMMNIHGFKQLYLYLVSGYPCTRHVWDDLTLNRIERLDDEDYVKLKDCVAELKRRPHSLRNMCARRVRSCISNNVIFKVESLNLPKYLKELVTLDRPML